jgi:hypothetical protein
MGRLIRLISFLIGEYAAGDGRILQAAIAIILEYRLDARVAPVAGDELADEKTLLIIGLRHLIHGIYTHTDDLSAPVALDVVVQADITGTGRGTAPTQYPAQRTQEVHSRLLFALLVVVIASEVPVHSSASLTLTE